MAIPSVNNTTPGSVCRGFLTQSAGVHAMTANRIAQLKAHCYWGGIGLPETDGNGNECLVFPTGHVETATGHEIREWRCTDGSGMGYITSLEPDGHEPCWMWYGPGQRMSSLTESLAFLRDGGHITEVANA